MRNREENEQDVDAVVTGEVPGPEQGLAPLIPVGFEIQYFPLIDEEVLEEFPARRLVKPEFLEHSHVVLSESFHPPVEVVKKRAVLPPRPGHRRPRQPSPFRGAGIGRGH